MKITTHRCVVTAVLLAGGCTAESPLTPDTGMSPSRSAAACRNVSGTITAQAVPILDGDRLIGFSESGGAVTGDLAGTTGAELYVVKVGEDGTLHFAGGHSFQTDSGLTLATSDRGVVSSEGRVHNSLRIVSGGSGELQTHGTVSPELLVELRYHGRVCP